MKLTKTLICALAMGAMTFASSKALAVQGTLTVSGTALYQGYNTNKDFYVAKKQKFGQKDLLFLLEQATGDTSITNTKTAGKTVIIYDPDAFNYNGYDSIENYYFYGTFYYSNSVAGLTPLDGYDESGFYYSYIEFDFLDWYYDNGEGFWSPDFLEYNNIASENNTSYTSNGNGLLYVHSDPYDFDLPDGSLYYANDSDDFYQQYAIVLHGTLQSTWKSTSKTFSESMSLSGTGDGVWDYTDVTVSGKAKFSASEPND